MPLKVRLDPDNLVLAVPPSHIIRMDAEGRWCSFWWKSVFYRRLVDGGVVAGGRKGFRPSSPETIDRVQGRIADLVKELTNLLESETTGMEFHGKMRDLPSLLERLQRARRWTPRRYAEDALRFKEAYPESVPILPPDRYRDLVVQPAIGCPNGKCAFCAFYRGRPFRVLSREDFARHLERVRDFFGRALGFRNGVFLGSASALSIPREKLLEVFRIVKKAFGSRTRGVAAFHDPDHAPRRTAKDFANLAAAGLTHLTVGLETGLPSLRGKLGKSEDLGHVVRVIKGQKEAGIRSALTVLVGAGGRAERSRHRKATVEAIARMPLDSADLIYLSPLSGSMAKAEIEEEMVIFRRDLLAATAAKVSPYRIERFRYFT